MSFSNGDAVSLGYCSSAVNFKLRKAFWNLVFDGNDENFNLILKATIITKLRQYWAVNSPDGSN